MLKHDRKNQQIQGNIILYIHVNLCAVGMYSYLIEFNKHQVKKILLNNQTFFRPLNILLFGPEPFDLSSAV
jgi:hypothetical protein